MAAGQQFSFLATADCEKLRFRVPGTTFVAIPKAGPDTGARLRTYKVALTESEWNSLVDELDTTFTWSIIGTTSAGVTTRVTTTNELKVEGGVTIDLSTADAKLVGEEAGDAAGSSVSGAGDVDGDGPRRPADQCVPKRRRGLRRRCRLPDAGPCLGDP